MRKGTAAFDWLDELIGRGIRPGLDRMRRFLGFLEVATNRPWLMVAGTNGKGSTAATIDGILQAAGVRTLLYTSPHLVRLNERWRLSGLDVDDAVLVDSIERLRKASNASRIKPTYFEALTLLAFVIAETWDVETGILEVGMGGRLDATNVVDADVAAITQIDLDHSEWLGDTVEEIAAEKGGIIKPGSIAVTSNRGESVLRVLDARAEETGGSLEVLAKTCSFDGIATSIDGTHFRMSTPADRYELFSPLAGEHQVLNIGLAVRASELFFSKRELDWTAGTIERGVADTRWRGRIEVYSEDRKRLIVDGAHNPSGAESLVSFARMHLTGKICLVFGCLKDKDAKGMIDLLGTIADRIILTRVDSDRALDPRAIEGWLDDHPSVAVVDAPLDAIEEGWREEAPNVIVAGSLYLAGEGVTMIDRLRCATRPSSGKR